MIGMGWRLLLLSIVAALPGLQAALAQTSYLSASMILPIPTSVA
jgi:hypothetical protein